MIDIPKIIYRVLLRLSKMDYEKDGGNSYEQLIFPRKTQAKGEVNRVSEQELRLLFIEEFKIKYPLLFYSIETPTSVKYCFSKAGEINATSQSALHDMCIWDRDHSGKYRRKLNIEFKHKNTDIKQIKKDIQKLIQEKEDGVFIHLLDNTDGGTLCSVLEKYEKSFSEHSSKWTDENKSIQMVILSLKQGIFIHRILNQNDMTVLRNIFFVEKGFGNVQRFNVSGWTKVLVTGNQIDHWQRYAYSRIHRLQSGMRRRCRRTGLSR